MSASTSANDAPARVTVPKQPMLICTADDCGGTFATIQERCVCGARLTSLHDLFEDRALGFRMFAMLMSLRLTTDPAQFRERAERFTSAVARREMPPDPRDAEIERLRAALQAIDCCGDVAMMKKIASDTLKGGA